MSVSLHLNFKPYADMYPHPKDHAILLSNNVTISPKADDLATDGNTLRLLPGMAVRIRAEADSDCAECDGFIEQLEEGTDLAIVGFEGGGETAVCTVDLEPYKPEQGDLAKVLCN